jgi:hypothetical protein
MPLFSSQGWETEPAGYRQKRSFQIPEFENLERFKKYCSRSGRGFLGFGEASVKAQV